MCKFLFRISIIFFQRSIFEHFFLLLLNRFLYFFFVCFCLRQPTKPLSNKNYRTNCYNLCCLFRKKKKEKNKLCVYRCAKLWRWGEEKNISQNFRIVVFLWMWKNYVFMNDFLYYFFLKKSIEKEINWCIFPFPSCMFRLHFKIDSNLFDWNWRFSGIKCKVVFGVITFIIS